jgi:hypothetical protein
MCGIAREQLLLIPGIGSQSTGKIVAARRDTQLRDLFQPRSLASLLDFADEESGLRHLAQVLRSAV